MIPKFRAWMKQYEKMDNDIGEIYFEDGEFKYIGDDVHYKRLPEHVILMLSTGIKDKNGKEIFEGDIVQFEDCYEVSDFLYINTGIIEWCQGGFHVTNRDSVLMEDLLDGDSLDVTIIGNVYENPELLEEK